MSFLSLFLCYKLVSHNWKLETKLYCLLWLRPLMNQKYLYILFIYICNSQYTYMTLEKGNEYVIKHRRITTKLEITKNRNKWVNLPIKYNAQGAPIRKYSIYLTSYLSVLACKMVPINHKSWKDVPNELKHKLWDCIQLCNIHTLIDIFATLFIPYNLNILLKLFHLIECFHCGSTK